MCITQCGSSFGLRSRDFAKEENLGKDLKNKCQLREERRSKGFGDKENSRGPIRFKDLKEGQSGWSHREQEVNGVRCTPGS